MGASQSHGDAHDAAHSLQTVDWDVLSNAQLVCALRLVLHEATRSTLTAIDGPAIIMAFLESYHYDVVPFLRLKCRPQEHHTQTQECAALLARWPRPQLLELVDFLGLRGNLQAPLQLRLLSLVKQMVDRLVARASRAGDDAADDAPAAGGVYLARRVPPAQGNHVAIFLREADDGAHARFVRAADAADLPRLARVLAALRAAMGLPAVPAARVDEAREQLHALVWLLVPSRAEIAAWWRALPTPLQLLVRVGAYLDGLVPQPIREDDSYILLKALTKFYVRIHVGLMYELAAALVRGVRSTTLRAVRAAVRGWRWLRTLTLADVRRGAAATAARVGAMLPGTNLWVEHAGVREMQRAARIVGSDAGTTGARVTHASHAIAAVCAEFMATLRMDLVERERVQGHIDRAVQFGEVTPDLEAALRHRPDLLRVVRDHARDLRAALAEQRAALTRHLAAVGRDQMRRDVQAVNWFGGLLYRLYFIGQYLGASAAALRQWLTRPDALPASVDAMHAAAALVHGVPAARARSTLVVDAEENARTAGDFGNDLLALCVAFIALLRTTANGAAAAIPVLVQLWTDTVRDCRYGRHRDGTVRTRPRPRTVDDTLRAVQQLARQRAAAVAAAGTGADTPVATASNPFVFGVGGTARHPFHMPLATLEAMRARVGGAAATLAEWATSFAEFSFDDPFAAAFHNGAPSATEEASPSHAATSQPLLLADTVRQAEPVEPPAEPAEPRADGRAARWRTLGDDVFEQADRFVKKLQALLPLVRENANSPLLSARDQAKWQHLATRGNKFVDETVAHARMMRRLTRALAIDRYSQAEGSIILQGSLDKLRYEATLALRTVEALARRLPPPPAADPEAGGGAPAAPPPPAHTAATSAAAPSQPRLTGGDLANLLAWRMPMPRLAGGDLTNLQEWRKVNMAMRRVRVQAEKLQEMAVAGRDTVVDEVAREHPSWSREKQQQVFAKWRQQGSTPSLQAVKEAEWEVFDDEPWATPVPYRAHMRMMRAKRGHWRKFPNRLLLPTFVAALVHLDDRGGEPRPACSAAATTTQHPDPSLFRVGTGDTASDIQVERARVRQMLETCAEKVCRTTPVLTSMAAFTAFWNGLDAGARQEAMNQDRKVCVEHGKFCDPASLVATQQKRVEGIIGRVEADMETWLRDHGMDHGKPSITMCLLGVRGDKPQSVARKALRKYHPDRARSHVDRLVRGQVMRVLTDALVTAKTAQCPSDAAAAEGTAKLANVIARAKAVATEFEDVLAHVRAADAGGE